MEEDFLLDRGIGVAAALVEEEEVCISTSLEAVAAAAAAGAEEEEEEKIEKCLPLNKDDSDDGNRILSLDIRIGVRVRIRLIFACCWLQSASLRTTTLVLR